ncbi:MAG: AAA family ATPase [Thermoplasmata archaeon]|nr:AAA family ATPase [Thermoplasmata archaeon]
MIIERPDELERISKTKKWVLVYGRRKTGKTFLVERFVDHDEFFFVRRDRQIISKKGMATLNYDTFLAVLIRALEDGKTVVVDEFQRLGDDFLDILHQMQKHGKLILISSTLHLSKRLLSGRSALLGLFAEVPVGLISMRDCMNALDGHNIGKKEMVEFSIMMREPLAVDYIDVDRRPRDIFADILTGSIMTVPALVGEVFTEEERSVSAVYEGILRAIGGGKEKTGEISSHLFSNKLIKKDDPSLLSQYLNNMVGFGIIKKIAVHGKRRFVYKHVSPLVKLFYYADEKYHISERAPGKKEIARIIDEVMPKLVEDNLREFLAQSMGLTEVMVEEKDYDVDILLLKFKKPELAIEVKWGNVTKSDVARAGDSLARIGAPETALFVPDKKMVVTEGLDVWDIWDVCRGPGESG